ncbi:MAG: MOSC domain-containing protein [Anaerolineaceae bacterium]
MHIQYKLDGRAVAVLVGEDADSLVSSRRDWIETTFAGIQGDKHSGVTCPSGGRTPFYPRGSEIRNYRQVSIISAEEMKEVAAALQVPEILPEWLGANLLISGIKHLTQLPPFTRLFFGGGTVLVVQRDNEPCVYPGKILARQFNRPELEKLFTPSALEKRGLVACVERPGLLRAGESVRAETPLQVIYSPDD